MIHSETTEGAAPIAGPAMRHHAGRVRLALLLCAMLAAVAAPARAEVTVFAAASLTDVLQPLADAYAQTSGQGVRVAFGSSATLARQIAAGAPADLFISADAAWMDTLEATQAIVPASRRVLAGNRLVLVAPAARPIALTLTPGLPLADALDGGRLALADPDSVPAGRYARAALTHLGAWDAVAPHLVRGEDVRHALRYVARGEAPLGIVYLSDARAEPAVVIVAVFPEDSHPPIVYPMAAAARAAPAAAEAFMAYLLGDVAQSALRAAGFTAPP